MLREEPLITEDLLQTIAKRIQTWLLLLMIMTISQVRLLEKKVIKSLDVYVTPWGTIEFIPSRENRGRTVHVMQDDMWAVAVLRGTKNVELAKTGDNSTRQVVTELTLVAKNEKSSGLGVDFSTS